MNFLYFYIFAAALRSFPQASLASPNRETIKLSSNSFLILRFEQFFIHVCRSKYLSRVVSIIFNSYGNSLLSSITKGRLDLRPGINGKGFAI